MTGTLQHSAFARFEREHMPRPAEILGFCVWPDTCKRSYGALRRGDSGGRIHGVDRHSERRLVIIRVRLDHLVQIELAAPFPGHRHANQALCMRRHEVYVRGGGESRRADTVAFVFAILIIGDNNNLTARERGETFLNTIEFLFQNSRIFYHISRFCGTHQMLNRGFCAVP